jgi:L-threonylcarbamoyladenylate synthase
MSRIVEPTVDAIADAARSLADGGVVAFPTETVYGLGADTRNADALRKVYELKGRPSDNPLIAHVLDEHQARSLAQNWSDRASALAHRFWPGPLTLIVEKDDDVPREATAGLSTIAVRSPSHPVARRLLEAFGRPISAPSANRSGHVSPTRAEHVATDFADVSDLVILDGGPSECGIESTVVDLTGDLPRILRPGAIDAEAIASALGEEVLTPDISEQLASPGTSPRHYAPHTPIELLSIDQIDGRLRESEKPVIALVIGGLTVAPPHRIMAMPEDAEAYAAQLFDALRRADAMNMSAMLIERPPRTSALWRAIHDRLNRAVSRA